MLGCFGWSKGPARDQRRRAATSPLEQRCVFWRTALLRLGELCMGAALVGDHVVARDRKLEAGPTLYRGFRCPHQGRARAKAYLEQPSVRGGDTGAFNSIL